MKVKNPKTEVPYWDEGQRVLFRWYQKGFWKRFYRKRFIKRVLKDNDFKTGERILADYELGDAIPLVDGIHYGYEGAFVVYLGKVVAIFEAETNFMFDKWGGLIESPDLK